MANSEQTQQSTVDGGDMTSKETNKTTPGSVDQPNSRRLAKTWPYPRHITYERQLRVTAGEWFKKKGFAVDAKYPFILSQWEEWPRNIISDEVVAHIRRVREERESQGAGFPLHKYLHHGLSSQAMLFNLVGPLIVKDDLRPLRTAIENAGLAWPVDTHVAQFEFEDRKVFNEDSGQPTSIDLVIGDPSKPALYVEAKLVEKEFGGCSVSQQGDCDGRNPAGNKELCYLHHIGRQYWTVLEKHGFLEGPMSSEKQCVLMANYQYFRELMFAVEREGTLVLLCDERSPTFYCDGPKGKRGLIPFLMEFTPPELRRRVGLITIQSLVAETEKTGKHPWIQDFKEKYGLI